MNNQTLKTFGYPELTIKEYRYWVVLLRYKHVTPGSLVIVTKTDAVRLGGLSSEEWAEFAVVSKDCEKLLKKTFKADKFNYLALMMKDPNVHFHFIPRYAKPVNINGKEFVDQDWPEKTELMAQKYSDTDLREIRQKLEQNL